MNIKRLIALLVVSALTMGSTWNELFARHATGETSAVQQTLDSEALAAPLLLGRLVAGRLFSLVTKPIRQILENSRRWAQSSVPHLELAIDIGANGQATLGGFHLTFSKRLPSDNSDSTTLHEESSSSKRLKLLKSLGRMRLLELIMATNATPEVAVQIQRARDDLGPDGTWAEFKKLAWKRLAGLETDQIRQILAAVEQELQRIIWEPVENRPAHRTVSLPQQTRDVKGAAAVLSSTWKAPSEEPPAPTAPTPRPERGPRDSLSIKQRVFNLLTEKPQTYADLYNACGRTISPTMIRDAVIKMSNKEIERSYRNKFLFVRKRQPSVAPTADPKDHARDSKLKASA